MHLPGPRDGQEGTDNDLDGGLRHMLSIVGRLRVRHQLVHRASHPAVSLLRAVFQHKRGHQPRAVVTDQRNVPDQVCIVRSKHALVASDIF